MKNETTKTWHPIRDVLNRLDWHYIRIENGAGSGIPDVNFCIPGSEVRELPARDIWLEAKYLDGYPNGFHDGIARMSIGLRATQYAWMHKAIAGGRQIWIVCRVADYWLLWHVVNTEMLVKLLSGFKIGELKLDVFSSPRTVISYIASNYGLPAPTE